MIQLHLRIARPVAMCRNGLNLQEIGRSENHEGFGEVMLEAEFAEVTSFIPIGNITAAPSRITMVIASCYSNLPGSIAKHNPNQ